MRADLSPLKLRTPSSAKHLLKKHASRMRPLASMATHLHQPHYATGFSGSKYGMSLEALTRDQGPQVLRRCP
jgi:hypothetical protein